MYLFYPQFYEREWDIFISIQLYNQEKKNFLAKALRSSCVKV